MQCQLKFYLFAFPIMLFCCIYSCSVYPYQNVLPCLCGLYNVIVRRILHIAVYQVLQRHTVKILVYDLVQPLP